MQYSGPGGSAELFGVYFADETQHQEHRLWVDHAVPNCKSNVKYKGALQGEDARTVWIGDVRIRPAATGTDTYELNRNLVLTDGARADSVPNLEIETGEIVGAGHASATGRFDDEQLFYLCSRGIDAETARRLVVRGFFADVVQEIGLPELQDRLMGTIEARLGALPGLEDQPVEQASHELRAGLRALRRSRSPDLSGSSWTTSTSPSSGSRARSTRSRTSARTPRSR